MVVRAVRRYRNAMRMFADQSNLEVWYARLDVAELLANSASKMSSADRKAVDRTLRKARAKTSTRALTKLTEIVDGERRFRSEPPLLVPLRELLGEGPDAAEVRDHLHGVIDSYQGLSFDRRHLYGTYRVVDVARKVVGVGSVGTRAWVILLLGRDADDPLVLQAKEAQRSVLEPFAGRSRASQHGRRVVDGQRLMQAASDIFLGWRRLLAPDGVTRDFYIRQLWDGKASADLETINAERLAGYSDACGWTLARAHARSGDRVAISSYLGKSAAFDEAIADFSERYADQNQEDYELVRDAAEAGRIPAQNGA
jgi:Uncharacterized protein conserved in bacteria (DUF2252)